MTNTFARKRSVALLAVLMAALLLITLFGVSAWAAAEEEYEGEMILEPVVTTTADVSETGAYRSISAGDTFTVVYKLVKNDGMVEAIFTPAYDKDAFELTSFATDTTYWTIFDNYGGMTAAEYIADRNQKYAAGEIDDFRLSFLLNYGDVRDPDGVLSDEFITIVYTARADLTAPEADAKYAFGFDTVTLGGQYTNAAKSGDKLLSLLLKVGEEQGQPVTEPLGADTFSIDMRAELAISVDEDQTISFRYNAQTGEYYLDPNDIAVTFDEGDKDAYLEETGAAITYTFYTKNPETGDYEPILDEQTGEPALPSAPDAENIYVVATAAGTDHYGGAVSDPVHVVIAPIYLDLPDLRLYDSRDAENYLTPDASLEITGTEAPYGTTFTLVQVVNDEEVAFDMPATSTASQTGLNYTYEYAYSGATLEPGDNLLDGELHGVGTYVITISTPDPTFVKFAGTDLSRITIAQTVVKKVITLTTLINGESSVTLTYGDAAPETAAFTYTGLEGIVETGDARAAVVADINPTIHPRTTAYTQYAPASTYYYYTAGTSTANYDVVTATQDACINVNAITLTLVPTYDGDKVTFSVEGVIHDDTMTLTYYIGETPLAGNEYTLTAADLGKSLIAKVYSDNYNYGYGEATLAQAISVTFVAGDGFGAATGMPATQYLFAGQCATEPAAPACPSYSFVGWTLAGEPYDFGTAVTANITLTADWSQYTFNYKFRAINASTDLLTGASYALAWDDENDKFVIATTTDPVTSEVTPAATADSASFDLGTLIPTAVDIKGFYVKRWLRVIPQQSGDPTVTEVTAFDLSAASDVAEDAYYLAEMVLNLGRGDVNGDGSITTLDILTMKRYLVGTSVGEIRTEQEAWEAVLLDNSNGDWFYPALWDVNGDDSNDTRDIVALREALATGYGFVVATGSTADGEYCIGQQVASVNAVIFAGRVLVAEDEDALAYALTTGTPVRLGADVAFESLDLTCEGAITIDLDGHTITADALTVTAGGAIYVTNGTLEVASLSLRGEGGVIAEGVKDPSGDDVVADGSEQNVGWTL